MRLWHKDLIPALPRKQLLGQWRECCCIAKNISEKGTPNHILVNKIMDYPMTHFYAYGILVVKEMDLRGYVCDANKFTKYFTYPYETKPVAKKDIFSGWHNYRYFLQCYYKLQEKRDCNSITDDEWDAINKCSATVFFGSNECCKC